MTPQGVLVCMASHNSARFLRRTLASIDLALRDRPYALVIADDASTDDTLRMAREFPMAARERIIVGLPKAPSIGESKNRALKVAQPLFQRFPWIAFMDDDDEMLEGRFRLLLDRMSEEGQQVGIGDWRYHAPNDKAGSIQTGDWSLHTGMYSPGMTVIHKDVLPPSLDYFESTSRDVHEDMVTHTNMARRGLPWCYHGGQPVHTYHQRLDSFSGGPERSALMLTNTQKVIDSRPASATSIRSFCTVGFGPALAETEIMARSLRISGNPQPLVILTDAPGSRTIAGWGLPDVDAILVDIPKMEEQFAGAPTVYKGSSLNLGAFLGKMEVLRAAVDWHGSSLYLDSDMVVLRRFMDVIDAPVGLVPELNRSCYDAHPSSWDRNEKYGHFTGGCVYLSRDGRHVADWWRRDFLKSWNLYGNVEQAHGCFTDQSSLDLVALFGKVHTFHPGHNVQYTRIPHHLTPGYERPADVLRDLKIAVGHNLFFRGWPMVTIHSHFRRPNWVTHASRIFREVLRMSLNDRHHQILSIIERESP